MKIKQVGTKQGLQWILNGLYQFRQSPLVWIIICSALYIIIATLSYMLELYGLLIFIILFPVLQAGLWTGCRALEQGEKLQFFHLFSGFKISPVPLLTLGAISLVGQLLIFVIISTIAGDVAMDYAIEGTRVDKETEVIKAADNMLSALLVGIVLHIPLIMAIWFTPLLIVFNKMTPYEAMKLSFIACLSNFICLQVFITSLLLLGVITLIPYILFDFAALSFGLVNFVLMPIIYASVYASYKAIFYDV
tara:strand:+ start:2200 stop:2946 length:747 start_codon:yes stop_codon:yes gene_type:complete